MFDKIELYEMEYKRNIANPNIILCVNCDDTWITIEQYNINENLCLECFQESNNELGLSTRWFKSKAELDNYNKQAE